MITHPNVKVNLGLNVLRKREDGFHDLETLFVPYFDIYDTLEIVTGDQFSETSASLNGRYGEYIQVYSEMNPFDSERIAREGAPTLVQAISDDAKIMVTIARAEGVDWDPMKDLCVRAYRILDEAYGLKPVKIFLEKTSPVGAGLGGGSADAAFALKMLSEMFGLGLSEEELAGYAARLGSDCAFFVYNRPMIGEGRGELLSPYEVPDIQFGKKEVSAEAKTYELTVLCPEGIAVSTADAYRGIVPKLPETALRDALAMPVEKWSEVLFNDFETTVFAKYGALSAIKKSLYDSGATYAAMSGSGSALFAIYRK